MTPRPLFHQGAPLPALAGGEFAGSCRIQPLACELPGSEVRWFRIAEIPLDQSAAEARVRLVALDSVPKLECWMELTELTHPFTKIHQRLGDPLRGTLFAGQAALALHQLDQPLRARLGPDGAVSRPSGLFKLRGELPVEELRQGVRLSIGGGDPAHWVRHLEKHLCSKVDVEAWAETLSRRKWMTLRPANLKQAARFARDFPFGGPDSLDRLRPEHWPLLECYAEITLCLFEALLDRGCLHAARDPLPSPTGNPLWDELCALAPGTGDLAGGEELLVAEPMPGRLVVARGPGGLSRALRWRTSYADREERSDRIAGRARALRGSRGVCSASWPK